MNQGVLLDTWKKGILKFQNQTSSPFEAITGVKVVS